MERRALSPRCRFVNIELGKQFRLCSLLLSLVLALVDYYCLDIHCCVSAPVHPHVLIIVKTHENRVEHIFETLQMT